VQIGETTRLCLPNGKSERCPSRLTLWKDFPLKSTGGVVCLSNLTHRHSIERVKGARSAATPDRPFDLLQAMRQRVDSPEGRRRYSQRIATVEPVFGNLRHNKQLNRFTLRGLHKVGTQWRLFCLVHNIEKLARCELQ
jgi:hypothetical protein